MHSPSSLPLQDMWVLKASLTGATDDQLLIITRQPCELSLMDFLENHGEEEALIESDEDIERLEAHYGVDTWRGEIVTFNFNGAYEGGLELLRIIPIHSQDEIEAACGDENLMRRWRFGNVPDSPLRVQESDIDHYNADITTRLPIEVGDLYDNQEEYLWAVAKDVDYDEFIWELSLMVEQDDVGLILLLETHYNFHFVARISEHSLAFRARQRDGQDD